MSRFVMRAFLFTIMTLGWASASLAAFVEFSDRGQWEDWYGGVDDFSAANWDNYIIPTGGFFAGSNGIDGKYGEMTFTNPGTGNAPVIFDNDWSNGGNGPIGLGTSNVIASSSGIDVAWTGAVNGVGFELRGYGQSNPTTTFEIILGSGGELFTTTVNNPTGGFWGVVDTTGTISSVSINAVSGGSVTVMDEFYLSHVVVPAPGGLMILCGLVGLVLSRRANKA